MLEFDLTNNLEVAGLICALILCAGFGKRLNPLTLNTPKPLLDINNITLLENCINLVIKLGIKKIFINVFHLSDQIIDFIKKSMLTIDYTLCNSIIIP